MMSPELHLHRKLNTPKFLTHSVGCCCPKIHALNLVDWYMKRRHRAVAGLLSQPLTSFLHAAQVDLKWLHFTKFKERPFLKAEGSHVAEQGKKYASTETNHIAGRSQMRKCLLEKEISKSLEGSLKDYEVHGEESADWNRLFPTPLPSFSPQGCSGSTTRWKCHLMHSVLFLLVCTLPDSVKAPWQHHAEVLFIFN